MGVDAEMFVRLHGPRPTERELRRLAASMCARLGTEPFFIMRGDEDWQRGEQRHALSFGDAMTAAEARNDYKDGAYPAGLAALEGVPDDRAVWQQDGLPIVFDADEHVIKVNLSGRYYGPGYERGDWPTLRAVAEYLEHIFPGAEVWYGGDSSGICAERLDASARAAMTAHFYAHGHDPYRGAFGFRAGSRERCTFCGDRPMNECGGGGDRTFWQCDGCGLERVTAPGKPPRDLKRGEDFSSANA